MAAHLRSIRHQCEYPGCPKPAVEQVYSTRNAPMGSYCLPHAKRALAQFIREYPEEGA